MLLWAEEGREGGEWKEMRKGEKRKEGMKRETMTAFQTKRIKRSTSQ